MNVACDMKTIPWIRFIVLVLATSVAGIALSCSFAFNFAVVCGINSTEYARSVFNENPEHSRVMYFDDTEAKYLYSSYSFGILLMLLTMLTEKYQQLSLRWIVFCATMLSSVLTIVIPILYDWNQHSTIVLKVLQGAAVAPTIPLIGQVSSRWAPQNELGMFIAVLTCYSQIGLFFLMATSGPLCENYGWRSIFYFNGFISLIIGSLWLIFFRDNPAKHPWIEKKEIELIESGKSDLEKKKTKVPWKPLFSCKAVWACLIACVGNYNGVSPFIVFATVIMKKGLNLTDMECSYFNSASFALQLLAKLVSGKLSDYWKANETFKLRIFNTFSCGLCGLLAIITAFIPSSFKYTCAAFLALLQGTIGFNAAGFNKAAVIIGRQHAHAILTLYGFILTTSTIFEPFLVDIIAPQSTWDQWFWLFIIHGIILVATNAVFCYWVKGQPARFTQMTTADNKLLTAPA